MGFPRPILHGLCSLGVSVRLLLAGLAGGRVERLRSVKVRLEGRPTRLEPRTRLSLRGALDMGAAPRMLVIVAGPYLRDHTGPKAQGQWVLRPEC